MGSKPVGNITSSSRGRSMTNIGREINELLRDYSSPGRQRLQPRRIKRILLTRRYKDSNVYNDLGIRITGGKRLPNGDLGAFVTGVNRGKAFETLGEVQEGDQVLEWNGILLNGRTFEEVERIITSTKGEIEVIIKSNLGNESNAFPKTENVYDNVSDNVRQTTRRFPAEKSYWATRAEAPPIPAHRSLSPSYYSGLDQSMPMSYDSQRKYYQQQKSMSDSLGTLQVALSYDQINGILRVTIMSARNLRCREYGNTVMAPNPFVKVYLLPGRKVSNKRRTKYIANTANPDWHQTVEYYLNYQDFPAYFLELTVWNYDKYNDNICLGQVNISLSDTSLFNNLARSYPLQSPDQTSVMQGVGTVAAPTTRLRTQSFYNPTSLDLGYPAIC